MKEPEKICAISANMNFRLDDKGGIITETTIVCGSCPYKMAFSTFRETAIEDAEEIIREEMGRQQQECNLFVKNSREALVSF